MFEVLGISAVHPALLWSALGVAAPIAIHLWNRRRLVLVDWAAMDFLLQAEKRTRRRVQLENLLLLALRVLAVAIASAIVARPFLTSNTLANVTPGAAGVDRVVVLDDSPSMNCRSGKGSLFDDAKAAVAGLVRDMDAERSSDTFTLIVTSRPHSPVISRRSVVGQAVDDLLAEIDRLSTTDLPASFERSFTAIRSRLQQNVGVGAAIYIVTDGRARDWLEVGKEGDESPIASQALREVARLADRCWFVDLASESTDNVVMTALKSADRSPLAGVESRWEATIHNSGPSDVRDLEVLLSPSDGVDIRRRIDRIAPGESVIEPFTYLFAEPGSFVIRASVDSRDQLSTDDSQFRADVVRPSLPVLIVDGDPHPASGRPESFFLARALSPPGAAISGNQLDVVAEIKWDEVQLEKYELVCLMNPYRLSDERVAALEQWVRSGGGLLIALGDQTDETEFNAALFKNGAGLSPLRLLSQEATDSAAARRLTIESLSHPVLSAFDGDQSLLLASVGVRRWWRSDSAQSFGESRTQSARDSARESEVLARLDDPDRSPAIAERRFGSGRVMLFTFPLDSDWSNWPSEPSYVLSMLETARYLAPETTDADNLIVGQRWRSSLDPVKYHTEARLSPPRGDALALIATPIFNKAANISSSDLAQDIGGQSPPAATVYDNRETPTRIASSAFLLESEPLLEAGVYRVERALRSGGIDTNYVCVNLDPSESELRKASDAELRRVFGDAPIELVHDAAMLSLKDGQRRAELWRPLVVAMIVVLCAEQTLASWFGKRRQ